MNDLIAALFLSNEGIALYKALCTEDTSKEAFKELNGALTFGFILFIVGCILTTPFIYIPLCIIYSLFQWTYIKPLYIGESKEVVRKRVAEREHEKWVKDNTPVPIDWDKWDEKFDNPPEVPVTFFAPEIKNWEIFDEEKPIEIKSLKRMINWSK